MSWHGPHRGLLSSSLLMACAGLFAQPPNDNCGSAQLVTPNGTCYAGTTAGANDSWIGTVGCAGNNADVWYSFVATGSVANFQVTSGTMGGNIEIVLVSSTSPCNGLGLEGSVCAPSPVNLNVSYSLVVGNTYYYTISSTGATGTFTTCVTTANTPPSPGLDCTTASPLCTNAPFNQGNFTGIGATEEISQNSCFGLDERQSKWYTFTCSVSGTIQLLVNPINYNSVTQTGDDFDFALWDVTNGCYVMANILPVPIACNWSGCVGSTGIAPTTPYMGQLGATDYENNNPPGPGDCLSSQQWVTTAVNLVACKRYALLIDNYTTSSGGFSVAFAGTAVIGPNATFTYTLDPLCHIVTVNRNPYCTSNAMLYSWNYGDGYTNTAPVPAPHTYASNGNYTISLLVQDANGCLDTYSQIVDVGCVVLPIQLVEFDAIAAHNAVLLNWTTASEKDNDHFTVERSADDVTYEALGSIKGAGNSMHSIQYSWRDDSPLDGLSYYRLRQTDVDGKSTLSRTVTVVFERDLGALRILPVPTSDHCDVIIAISQSGLVHLVIDDVFGRQVMTQEVGLLRGANTISVDLHALVAGTYMLRVISSGDQRSARLVIE